MKINSPMLFNGQHLATYVKLFEKLGLTSNNDASVISGVINKSWILGTDSKSFTGADVLVTAADTETISAAIERLTTAVAKVKQYNVVKATGTALEVTPADATVDGITTTTFTVDLNLADKSLEQSETGLKIKVADKTLVVGESGLASGIKLAKLDTATDGFAASYQLVDAEGAALANSAVINIPKDQFLKAAEYDAENETINFTFEINAKDADGKITSTEHKVSLPVGDLIDTYNAGAGLDVDKANNTFSVKLGAETAAAGTLTVDADGVHFVDNLNYTTVRYGAIPVLADLTEEQKAAFVKNTLVINESTGEAAVVAVGGTAVHKLTTDVASAILKDASGNLTTPDYVPTSEAVVEYVDDFAEKKGFSAIVILEGELGTTVETAPAVNTLFVDVNGQTGIVAAGDTAVKDISQGYTDSIADDSADDDLTTVKAVKEYVGAELSKLDTQIDTRIDGIDTRIDGVDTEISTLKSGKVDKVVGGDGNLVAFGADGAIADSGKTITGEVTGSANVVTDAAVKTYVDTAVSGLQNNLDTLDINKFELVSGFVTAPEAGWLNDKLYFTADGQAKIFDGDTLYNLSMEASTNLAEDAPETKVVTAKAAKDYVDDQTTEVKAKAVEMLEGQYSIGGNQTAQVPGRVIAVYDAAGDQCYPSIKYANGSSVISIDDLADPETFTIIYAKRINAADGALA